MHRWLQEDPQQDFSLDVVQRQELSSNDSASDGDVSPSVDGGSVNPDLCLPETDNSRTRRCSDSCRRVSLSAADPPLYDSLVVQEADGRSRRVSSCRSPNMVLVDVERTGHSEGEKVIAGDYLPLCTDVMEGNCLQLCDVGSKEYDIAGGSFNEQLTSTPHPPSNLGFQSSTSSNGPLSVADRIITSDVPSSIASSNETTKLPISFSADSLELSADEDRTNSVDAHGKSRHLSDDDCSVAGVKILVDADDSEEADAENSRFVNYDLADIDAVLDHIANGIGSAVADVDASSQVSYDSLDDAV